MLPVGLIAIYQTQVVIENAQTAKRAALMSQVDSEASKERELIENALAASRGLSVLISRLGVANCDDLLRGFVEGNSTYIFAGYVQASGMMDCSSTGEAIDLSHRDTYRTAMERDGPTVQFVEEGAVTGRTILIVTQPVRDGDRNLGFVTLSIPHAVVVGQLDNISTENGLLLAAIDPAGNVLSATGGLDAAPAFLPADIAPDDMVNRQGETFRARTGKGEERFFAVSPMVPDTVFLVGSWPISAVPESDGASQIWLATSLPVLMWLAGVGVALFGMERLVVRHVAQLRSAMRRFALGDRSSTTLELADPPSELEEAQRAFNRMALLIADSEARREQDLKDKEVLLREVHHRVKNNLQLIASIMNMQARDLETEEAKHVVAELQRRVRGMAVLHKALYNTAASTMVDAADLVCAVVQDANDHPGSNVVPGIDTKLQPVDLYPDQAVPLSLLVAETLNEAIRRENGRGGRIDVDLSATEDGEVTLSIGAHQAHEVREPRPGNLDGLSHKMISAFLRQLDGKMETTSEDGCYRVKVRFPRAVYSA
ncbi:sensor histidine kinase [Antarctobacter jejuensis]|uniref:sensor histidine kinase n=1 Tax=Antarctobacter jejuensis TaxID=1439938 RepID=UPI003FD1E76F